MRILVIADAFGVSNGGGALVACQWSGTLVRGGHSVSVTTTPESLAEAHCTVTGALASKQTWRRSLETHRIDELSAHVLADRTAIHGAVTNFSPDILIVMHQWNLCPTTIWEVNRLPIPKLYRFGDEWLRLHYLQRMGDPVWRRLGYRLGQLEIRSATFNSSELRSRYRSLLGSNSRASLTRNRVDLERFRFRHRSSPSAPLRLIFLGRLVSHKGAQLTIPVVTLLRSAGFDVRLTICGIASDRSEIALLCDRIAQAELAGFVDVVSNIGHHEIPALLDRHDVLLFPSLPRSTDTTIEGCPSVLLEAIACGLPIVCSPTIGAIQILDGERLGMIAADATPEGLATAVLNLVRDTDTYSRISRAQEAERANYDLASLGQDLEALLSEARLCHQ